MKNVFLICLFSLIFLGCGRDIICDCFDQSEDAIYFSFDTSDITGFKPEEIDTFFIYRLAKYQPNVLDTVTFAYDPVHGYLSLSDSRNRSGLKNGFILNNGSLFENGRFSDYDYIVFVPEFHTFQINNLEISGKQGGDCNCYANTKKLVTVNGVQYDLTNKDPQQNAIVLTK